MDLNTALILALVALWLIERFKDHDVQEQIRAERNEIRRDEHSHHAKHMHEAFELYKKAINHGWKDSKHDANH